MTEGYQHSIGNPLAVLFGQKNFRRGASPAQNLAANLVDNDKFRWISQKFRRGKIQKSDMAPGGSRASEMVQKFSRDLKIFYSHKVAGCLPRVFRRREGCFWSQNGQKPQFFTKISTNFNFFGAEPIVGEWHEIVPKPIPQPQWSEVKLSQVGYRALRCAIPIDLPDFEDRSFNSLVFRISFGQFDYPSKNHEIIGIHSDLSSAKYSFSAIFERTKPDLGSPKMVQIIRDLPL